MPVRKIPKNYRNLTGVASRARSTGKAMFESTLERDFTTLLEFDSRIDTFEVQPVTVRWFDSTETERSYTPDVLASLSAKGLKQRSIWISSVMHFVS